MPNRSAGGSSSLRDNNRRAPGPSPLDRWVAPHRVRTRHGIDLPVAPAIALEHLLASPVAPDRLVRALFAIRGLKTEGAISEAMPAGGFGVLEQSPEVYVLGLIVRNGRRQTLASAQAWPNVTATGMLRIAAAFWAEVTPSGSRLHTETRVDGRGAGTWLLFRAYWLVVRPFSDLVRHRWLRAVRERP